MEQENTSIHEFDFNLICEYFSSINRQGPGSPEATIKALSFIENLNENAVIADIGCGTGGQTLVLANNTQAKIFGLDLFPNFIEFFNENFFQKKLDNRVSGIVGSMDNLPFQENELDIIWSEGAIYNIGFERGLNEWKKFLKTNGYLAVTEVSWFTEKRPQEIQNFWMDAYPEIDTISNKIDKIQKAGYIPVASFILSENCWKENFYEPQVVAQEAFLKKYADNEMIKNFIQNMRHEANMYSKYKEFYGYVFYIAKKI